MVYEHPPGSGNFHEGEQSIEHKEPAAEPVVDRTRLARKLVGVAAITISSLFAKEATAQQKKVVEVKKDTLETPMHIATHYHEISPKKLLDFKKYQTYFNQLPQKVKDKMFEDKAFAKQIFHEYLKIAPGSSLNDEVIGEIQEEFPNYRAWLLYKIEYKLPIGPNHTLEDIHIKNIENFMKSSKGLSKTDQAFAEQTAAYNFDFYPEYLKEMHASGKQDTTHKATITYEDPRHMIPDVPPRKNE